MASINSSHIRHRYYPKPKKLLIINSLPLACSSGSSRHSRSSGQSGQESTHGCRLLSDVNTTVSCGDLRYYYRPLSKLLVSFARRLADATMKITNLLLTIQTNCGIYGKCNLQVCACARANMSARRKFFSHVILFFTQKKR